MSDSSLKQIMEWLTTVEEAKSVHINNYFRERETEREIKRDIFVLIVQYELVNKCTEFKKI